MDLKDFIISRFKANNKTLAATPDVKQRHLQLVEIPEETIALRVELLRKKLREKKDIKPHETYEQTLMHDVKQAIGGDEENSKKYFEKVLREVAVTEHQKFWNNIYWKHPAYIYNILMCTIQNMAMPSFPTQAFVVHEGGKSGGKKWSQTVFKEVRTPPYDWAKEEPGRSQ